MEQLGRTTVGNSFKHIEQAGSGMHQAIDRLSETARPALSRAASGAHRLVDRVAGTTSRVAQQLGDTGTRMKSAEERLVSLSSGYVRQHPFAAIGLALAVGVLVSRLLMTSRPQGSGRETAASEEPSF